ncbi:MAG: hypothetical protein WAW52_00045 [Methanothrix sp.]
MVGDEVQEELGQSNQRYPIHTKDIKMHLIGGLNAAKMITAYALALLNIRLLHEETLGQKNLVINECLAAAQVQASFWVKTLGPEIVANPAQTIVSYNDIFSSIIDTEIEIVHKIIMHQNSGKTDELMEQLKDIIGMQLEAIRERQETMLQLEKKIDQFSDGLQKAYDHLSQETIVDSCVEQILPYSSEWIIILISSLINQCNKESNALHRLSAAWESMEEGLKAILEDQELSGTYKLPAVVGKMELKSNEMAWADLACFAKRIQSGQISTLERRPLMQKDASR